MPTERLRARHSFASALTHIPPHLGRCGVSNLSIIDWISPNSYIEAYFPDVPAFGDRAFKEAIEVKWGHKSIA